MKVIFLDIDGVLNTESYITSAVQALKLAGVEDWSKSLGIRDEYGSQFDPMSVRFLNWIVQETDAKIVISSTWRGSGLKVMQDMWKERNLPGEVIDITPWTRDRNRGQEIDMWIKSKFPEVESYVILDDDIDMLPEQHERFINVDFQYGISSRDAARCIDILNKT